MEEMFKKDQRLDLPYYFRIGQKTKDRYATKKFTPNSEKQIRRLKELLNKYGYPGEQLIGNDFWMSTILVHHNSISTSYSETDTLYPSLQPLLLTAIQKDQMAPDDYALIEDWYVAVKSNHKVGAFGYVSSLNELELLQSDELRESIGLCSIQTRNRLIDIQEHTGMNFYLDGIGWVKK
jgi:hypothetical protein